MATIHLCPAKALTDLCQELRRKLSRDSRLGRSALLLDIGRAPKRDEGRLVFGNGLKRLRFGLSLGDILDRRRLWALDLLRRDLVRGDTKLELLLGLGGTVQLLVDRDVGRIEGDIGAGRVRVALEANGGGRCNVQNGSKLEEERLSVCCCTGPTMGDGMGQSAGDGMT